MKKRRVKITGIGIVSPAGIGKNEFEKNIISGNGFVRPITRFPKEGGEFVASEVKGFEPQAFFKETKLPRHTQFALAATELALEDAGLKKLGIQSLSPIVITGTSLMDSEVINQTITNVEKKGPRYALARVVFQGPVSSVSSTVARTLGGACTLTVQTACCSGLDAIGHGANIVSAGEADIAICGGTEAPIFYHPMLELKSAGLSPSTSDRYNELCRPFDLWRTTGVIGEGACICIIEPEVSVRKGYAFIEGYGYSTDVDNFHGKGLSHAMELCLANAGVKAFEVDAVNAWGPGHKEVDAMESRALYDVFEGRVKCMPTVSIKGAIGNPFAAAGALQVGSAVLGLRGNYIPPTVNWSCMDPECDLALSSCVRYFRHDITLVNSHGVSGTNACLLLKRCE
jgi:3-oxoacyl-[acyl-carrier-protein] synthase II